MGVMTPVSNDQQSPSDEPARAGLRVCARCRHQRTRPRPALFSPAELTSAEVLKAQLELLQQERQRAEAEQRRFFAGVVFDYEPYNYPWCARYTPLEQVQQARDGDEALLRQLLDAGEAVFNPVTAELNSIYAICGRRNPRGECEGYEPR
jgi:hypothetical protein